MEAKPVLFSEWMNKSFNIFKENTAVLILASLIAVLLSAVSFGILAGPMLAGLSLITLQLVDQQGKPEAGKVFEGFSHFLQTFLFCLVWGIIVMVAFLILNMIVCIGTLLSIVGSIALGTLLMFALFLIVDRRMEFWPASMASFQTVKTNFWPLLGYYLVASVIGQAGALVCGIGMIVTLPIGWCMLTVAYREFFPTGGAPTETPPQRPAA